ncbi:MAG: PrsW family glutamic-type intramembrane protease [Anaerolineae bacterium]
MRKNNSPKKVLWLLFGLLFTCVALPGFCVLAIRLADAMYWLPGAASIGVYLVGFCLPATIYILATSGEHSRRRVFRLPSWVWFAVGAPIAIVAGQSLLLSRNGWFFWLPGILAAGFAPLAAVALADQRLNYPTTWRRALIGIVSGSILAPMLTLLVSGIVTALAFALILPLREMAAQILAAPSLEKMFYSPALILVLVEAAVVAPLVEELFKPMAAAIMAKRLSGPAEAFLVGMAGGLGFAILENMLYESAGPRLWGGIAVLRSIGGVLHPLTAGLVAVGWYSFRTGQPHGKRLLLTLYALAVTIHGLWNGGLTILVSDIGTYFFGTRSWRFDIYGIGEAGIVIVFMLMEAIALWWLLVAVTDRLRKPGEAQRAPLWMLHLDQSQSLALWAATLLAILAPLAGFYRPILEVYASKLLP